MCGAAARSYRPTRPTREPGRASWPPKSCAWCRSKPPGRGGLTCTQRALRLVAGLPTVSRFRTTRNNARLYPLRSKPRSSAILSRGARDRRQRRTARAHGRRRTTETNPRPVRYGTNTKTKTRRLEHRTQNTSIPGDLQPAVDLVRAVLAEQPPRE